MPLSNFIAGVLMLFVILFPVSGKEANGMVAELTATHEVRGKISHTVLSDPRAETLKLVREAAQVIMVHEGFSSKPYKCSKGYWTQGYGRRIDSPNRKAVGEKQAYAWLLIDVQNAVNQLDAELPWWRDMSPVRKQVMINMVYNLGSSGIYKFKNFLAASEKGQYKKAAREILYTGAKKTKYWKEVGTRAEQLSQAMRHNEWIDLGEVTVHS